MITVPILDKRKKYLQIALNSTLQEAAGIIRNLPQSDRILLEAGTPLIKEFGMSAIQDLYTWWSVKTRPFDLLPYIVADLKTMDR